MKLIPIQSIAGRDNQLTQRDTDNFPTRAAARRAGIDLTLDNCRTTWACPGLRWQRPIFCKSGKIGIVGVVGEHHLRGDDATKTRAFQRNLYLAVAATHRRDENACSRAGPSGGRWKRARCGERRPLVVPSHPTKQHAGGEGAVIVARHQGDFGHTANGWPIGGRPDPRLHQRSQCCHHHIGVADAVIIRADFRSQRPLGGENGILAGERANAFGPRWN